ncbi:MAG: ferredoxin reductase [Gammaproteobacteria bacterium]
MEAKTWFNLSLFNTPRAGDYFEDLIQAIDPIWSLTECRARIVEVRNETHDTRTWVLRPTARWNGFEAGQHLHITVDMNGTRQTRTFTISSTPYEWREQGVITLTVKRVPHGRVTGWMHDHLEAGNVVSISQAAGDFVLPAEPEGPIVYFAAGSGITPIASQLGKLAACNMPVPATLLYFARSEDDFIFGAPLRALAQAHKRFTLHTIAGDGGLKDRTYSLPQGMISADHVAAALKNKPEYSYVCGPHPFREQVKTLLKEQGFPLQKVKEEAFGLPPVARTSGEKVTVNFTHSHTQATTDQPGTLLDMAEQAGLTPTAGCRMGICYTCKCTKKSGQVRNVITGEISSGDEEDIQICITAPVSDVTIEL